MTSMYSGLSPIQNMNGGITAEETKVSTALVFLFLIIFLVLVGVRLNDIQSNKVVEVVPVLSTVTLQPDAKEPTVLEHGIVVTPVIPQHQQQPNIEPVVVAPPPVVIKAVHKQKATLKKKERKREPVLVLTDDVTEFANVQALQLRTSFCLTHGVEGVCRVA